MIEDVITGIVVEVAEVEPEVLGPDVLLGDVDVDSLELIEVAVEVERAFGVRFEDADLKDIRTIRALADLARARGAHAG